MPYLKKHPRKPLFMATTRYFYRFHKKVSFKAILERCWPMILSQFESILAHFCIPDAFPLAIHETGLKMDSGGVGENLQVYSSFYWTHLSLVVKGR
jgi:hypothetical protein